MFIVVTDFRVCLPITLCICCVCSCILSLCWQLIQSNKHFSSLRWQGPVSHKLTCKEQLLVLYRKYAYYQNIVVFWRGWNINLHLLAWLIFFYFLFFVIWLNWQSWMRRSDVMWPANKQSNKSLAQQNEISKCVKCDWTHIHRSDQFGRQSTTHCNMFDSPLIF